MPAARGRARSALRSSPGTSIPTAAQESSTGCASCAPATRSTCGRYAVFRVTAVHQYPKAHFPAAAVYGPVPDAELHLITCGGTYDYATHNYLSNIVVDSTEVR